MVSFANSRKITTDVTHVNETERPDTIQSGSLAQELTTVNTTPSTEETQNIITE